MTAEELIIEHFDGTLSLEQEGELTQVLAASPEARATYDRYLRVNEVLVDDVVATAPSSALDERVMAAALGAIGGTIGGGTATWIGGKIAAAFSVVAIGGLSIFLLLPTDPDPVKTETPASTAPAPAVKPAPVVPTPTPAIPAPGENETTAGTTKETPKENVRTDRAGERPAATASRNKDRNGGKEGASTSTKPKPTMTLDGPNGTTIEHDPKLTPDKK